MRSWIDIPNSCDFSLFNVPFGVCSFPPLQPTPRCCTAIGNYAVDLSILAEAGLFCSIAELKACTFAQPTLNDFMSHPSHVWSQVRNRIIELFAHEDDGGKDDLRTNPQLREASMIPLSPSIVKMHLPANIGDYTDFYSSREHATNVGTMFRGKENALQPNWLHLPVGYHGRASSVVLSGTNIYRPYGQLQKDAKDPNQGSIYCPCKRLDFELEMAFFVGGNFPSISSSTITMEEAQGRIFGFVLMNDWSARDIQKWEYVPLGPFTSKNFATSISPWIVTTMALQPFQCPSSAGMGKNGQTDPKPLEYLQDPNYCSYDINLSVHLQGKDMSHPKQICQTNYKNMYWNARQQLVHHSVTGCNMQPGDLLASGTISGVDSNSFGSLLELSWNGTRPLVLDDSSDQNTRTFLEDHDTVIMTGFCEKEGIGRIGFGSCIGQILPAKLNSMPDESTSFEKECNDCQPSLTLYDSNLPSSSSSLKYNQILVRIVQMALNAKEIPYQSKKGSTFKSFTLEYMDKTTGQILKFTQPMTILELIEETCPNTGSNLYPRDIVTRSIVREITERWLDLLSKFSRHSTKEDGPNNGVDCVREELQSMEEWVQQRVKNSTIAVNDNIGKGPYMCGGFSPTIADLCMIAVLDYARDLDISVDQQYPTLAHIEKKCQRLAWYSTPPPK